MGMFLRVRGFAMESLEYLPRYGWEVDRLPRRRDGSTGDWSIALLGEGNPLFVHRFTPLMLGGCGPGQIGLRSGSVFEAVPLLEKADELCVLHLNRVLHSARIHAAPPHVKIGKVQRDKNKFNLDLAVDSPEKHTHVVIGYRRARGQIYRVHELEAREQRFDVELDLDGYPGSEDARLLVRVSDGVRSSIASSESFKLQEPAPSLFIDRPRGDVQIRACDPVVFRGMGSAADGSTLDPQHLRWYLDGKEVARGKREIALPPIRPGEHVAELRWSDEKRRIEVSTKQHFAVARENEEEAAWRSTFARLLANELKPHYPRRSPDRRRT